MSGAVAAGDYRILSFRKDLILGIHQESAERVITVVSSGVCERDCPAQVSYVSFAQHWPSLCSIELLGGADPGEGCVKAR